MSNFMVHLNAGILRKSGKVFVTLRNAEGLYGAGGKMLICGRADLRILNA